MWRVFLSCFFLILTGCSLDFDDEFYPVTHAGYFLTEENGALAIARIDANGLVESWNSSIGITSVTDLAADPDGTWISESGPPSIHFIDRETESLESYSINELTPHFMGAGDRYLLLADSVSNRIGFFSKKKETLEYSLPIERTPGNIVYRSGKFYLQVDEKKVLIYQEQAFALISEVSFPDPISDMQLNNGNLTVIHTQAPPPDSGLIRYAISFSTDQISQDSVPATYTKTLLTPFDRQRFGKEWLQDITLLPDTRLLYEIPGTPLENIMDFEVNFFEGYLYYRSLGAAADSLIEFNMNQRKMTRSFFFDKKIRKSSYNIREMGE